MNIFVVLFYVYSVSNNLPSLFRDDYITPIMQSLHYDTWYPMIFSLAKE